MMKSEAFDNKKTETIGLWRQPGTATYMSMAISLAQIKKYKGKVRIFVRRNKFYKKDSNRPNYVLWLCDSDSENCEEFEVIDADENEDMIAVFTREDVRKIINGAYDDCKYGHDPYDTLPEDFAEPHFIPESMLTNE